VAHGGSGYTFTRADVLDMDIDEARFLVEKLDANRKAEAAAIRNAGRQR
jgi:hypothetical protein